MRQTYYFLSFVLLLFVFISCSNDVVGKGTDTIGLETREVFFKSSKDSIELRTRKGDDWWLTEISTKDTIYRTHSLNVQVIEGGGLYVEKTGRKSIFIRVDSNLTGLERRFTTVIQAGNYYNTITIIQKANYSYLTKIKQFSQFSKASITELFIFIAFNFNQLLMMHMFRCFIRTRVVRSEIIIFIDRILYITCFISHKGRLSSSSRNSCLSIPFIHSATTFAYGA